MAVEAHWFTRLADDTRAVEALVAAHPEAANPLLHLLRLAFTHGKMDERYGTVPLTRKLGDAVLTESQRVAKMLAAPDGATDAR